MGFQEKAGDRSTMRNIRPSIAGGRHYGVILAALLVVGPSGFTYAAELRPSRPWKLFFGTDILDVGNAKRHAQGIADEGSAMCLDLVQSGATSCTYAITTYGAYGARAGLMFDLSDKWSIGPSLGYLYGGPTTIKQDISIGVGGNVSTVSGKATNHTVRMLAEMKRRFPIHEKWALSFGTGLGWALNNESITCEEEGFLSGSCATIPKGARTGWATWELTPSVLYGSFELGWRYVGFARGSALPWNTWGGFIGFGF